MRLRLKQQRLLELLAASPYSQNHWAIRLGLARGHWSEIVNGKHPYPSAKTRLRMLELLGVPLDELFTMETGSSAADDNDFRRAISQRFLIDNELGQGGMGAVYLARDVRHGRVVAIKVVSAEAVSGIGLTQFQREISTVAQLHHPHILPLHDSGDAAGQPFYVMPWVRGGSLRARLEARGRLPLPEAVTLVRGIASALEHAHAARVLHCDIKPENVLLDGLHPWVMDLGIARKLHSERLEWPRNADLDISAGTPAYVSPEQAAGDPDLDPRSDVYSLACLTWEMLAGRPPFEGSTTREIVSNRFIGAPPPLHSVRPGLPAAVEQVLERAMQVRREDRTASAAAFAAELADTAEARRSFSPVTRGAALLRQAAHRRARRETRTRKGRMSGWLEALGRDVALALRSVRRHAGFATLEIATFAVAIGLATAVFAAVNGILLSSLPYPDSGRLMNLQGRDSTGGMVVTVSGDNWYDWQRLNRTMAGIMLYQQRRFPVFASDEAVRVPGAIVTPNFTEVLKPALLAGRGFSAEQDDAAPEALISERLWRRSLGASGDTALSLVVNGVTRRVVGIVAAGQEFPEGSDLWLPFTHQLRGGAARNNVNFLAVGRLRDGVSRAQAQADLDGIARRIRESDPAGLYSHGVPLLPLRDWLVGSSGEYLWMLFGAVALLLLIACANLAGANLARAVERDREMAVRAALGGGRARLAQLLLVERLLVALMGGAAGLLLAFALTAAVRSGAASEFPRAGEIRINPAVVGFAFAVAALAAVLAGALPALRAAGVSLAGAMARGGRGAARGWRFTPGRMLVGAEVALAVSLVAAVGLTVQSFRKLLDRPLGFDAAGVVLGEITLGGPAFGTPAARNLLFWDALLEGLRADPAIAGAGLANWVPLGTGGSSFIELPGSDRANPGAGYRVVGDGYLEALGVPLLAGRMLERRDDSASVRVAVINQAMADAFWPGASPLGQLVRTPGMESGPDGSPPPWLTVVGVVGSVRHGGYVTPVRPEIYVPWRQVPRWSSSLTVVARARGEPAAAARAIREQVRRQDSRVAADIEPLQSRVDRAVSQRRFVMRVLGVFGALALGLAAVGVYGVLSLTVAQRSRELAVRAALGADRGRLLGLVLGGGLQVIGAGAAAGLLGAYFATQLLRSQLVETDPRDPMVFAGTVLVIVGAGVLAALIPALRATRADPAAALQAE